MINLNELDKYRLRDVTTLERYGSFGDDKSGAFLIPYPLAGINLRCLAANDNGWDHVSVSLQQRTPTWAEMDYIKRTFFKPEEVVMQLHVADDDHINCHPFCLHLWRPTHGKIPLPPKVFV